MATKKRRACAPTKPLIRTPTRIGALDAAAVVGELRDLHEGAEDPRIEQMPADGELYGALLYAERHASALERADEGVRRAAALKRTLLCEYLREQAEVHQVKAIEAARTAGVQWADLAPVLAVGGPSAAYNKAKRLRALTLADETHDGQPLRRTPEAVVEAERRMERRAAAQRREEEAAHRRHALMVPVAQRLLENRAGLHQGGDVTYWLDEVAEVLPHCVTPTQMVSLRRYMDAAVRELQKAERRAAQVAETEGARLAYVAAVELLSH
ncbi:hypothetical protein [Streptomyces avermitilis]|uniref:hypothetical protein n=1 Tax=Streptomyces avermitilis TaxID=33903 RepID=UPI00340A6802